MGAEVEEELKEDDTLVDTQSPDNSDGDEQIKPKYRDDDYSLEELREK